MTAQSRAHWDQLATRYDRWFSGWPFARFRRAAVAELAALPGERILLVGCGPAFERPLLPVDCDVLGVDYSGGMLRRARSRIGRGWLARMDAERLALPGDSFDAVLLTLIAAVAADGAAVVNEAVRVTRPGGRVVIVDKFRTPLTHALRRPLQRLGRRMGTDFDRPLSAVLGAQAGLVTVTRRLEFSGILRLVRLDVPR